jgi:hypothetical protein
VDLAVTGRVTPAVMFTSERSQPGAGQGWRAEERRRAGRLDCRAFARGYNVMGDAPEQDKVRPPDSGRAGIG